MSTDAFRKGSSKLRPRANIIHILGDELISSDMVAVTELVKNAYDADATQVIVRFRGDIENKKGEIEVVDNGTGMSLDTVKSGWLEPATQMKKKNRQTARGRRVLGEKGVGRFAAARLSSVLEMVTKETGADREIVVRFDWSAFDKSGYLDEVECEWFERAPKTAKSSGTVLHFTELKNAWTDSEIENLRRSLSRVISPFEHIKDFEVILELPKGFEKFAGLITPSELLSHPNYFVKGTVAKNGKYDLEYVGTAEKSEKIKGTFGKDDTFQCGPFEIELRVWNRDRPGIQSLTEAFNMSAKEARTELDDNAGIYIYRDEFRVLPYGEPNNDWLRLDIRRVQNPTMRVSNNQVVGCILVTNAENPALRDQTNREGLMAGKALVDLQDLTKRVLSLLEERRFKERRQEQPAKPPQGSLFTGFNLEPIRTALEEKQTPQQILEVVEAQEQTLADRVEQVQEVLARYKRLASLGKLVDTILHDGRTPINKIATEADNRLSDIKRGEGATGLMVVIDKSLQFIRHQADLLDQLFTRIEPFGGRKRGRPQETSIETIIKAAFSVEEGRIKRLGIQCDLPDSDTEVTVDANDIEVAFWNLLDNSLYWLEHFVKGEQRKILVRIKRVDGDMIEVLFCDNGPGVKEENRELIFEPYFSTKSNGIGLGLSIAGETVSEYGGGLELVDGPLSGACFRITLKARA